MTHFLHTQADLDAGLARLIAADPNLQPVAEMAGAFSLRRREAGFAGLCAIVCGQQLSTASAAIAISPPFGRSNMPGCAGGREELHASSTSVDVPARRLTARAFVAINAPRSLRAKLAIAATSAAEAVRLAA